MLYSNLWFISIATTEEAINFYNWLEGKMIRCNDTMEFAEWLSAHKAFPLEILLDGVHYAFKDRECAAMFLLGFEAAITLKQKI